MRLDLRVDLKTVDLVRDTAWLALRERMGWDESRLLALRRSTLWRFEAEAAGGEAALRRVLDAEVERSADFYNPNKERRAFLHIDFSYNLGYLIIPVHAGFYPFQLSRSFQLGNP